IYVTHDQVEAMTMADKIVVMHQGLVSQMGEPLELYDRPANVFVAGFIGSPAMNLIEGVVTDSSKPAFRSDGGAMLPIPANAGVDGRRRVTYGIRPEHVVLGGDIEATVQIIEPTGSETMLL